MTAPRRVDRVCLVVLDGLGIGGAPDAAAYGDEGSDSLGNCAAAVGGMAVPELERLGLGCLGDIAGVACRPADGTASGRLEERSAAKDSAAGHWELAGLVTDRPFPTFPEGFPAEVIGAFEVAIGRRVLGNRPASGTEILEELGAEHLRTGSPIVYTSGDSVFQVAAHRDVADADTLYGWCEVARGLLMGPNGVGRVIARPFAGEPGAFVRLAGRRDYALPPPGPTLLDRCAEAGVAVDGVGKIGDVFGMRGVRESVYARSDDDAVDGALALLARPDADLVFANLVDLDSKYGHRNDAVGYARCLEAFDRRIPELRAAVGSGILVVTGDHGCDPTTPSTDHSRERVPLLIAGIPGAAVDLGTRPTFADLGATLAELLGVGSDGLAGTSFAGELGL